MIEIGVLESSTGNCKGIIGRAGGRRVSKGDRGRRESPYVRGIGKTTCSVESLRAVVNSPAAVIGD